MLPRERFCLNWVFSVPHSLRFVDLENKLNWKRKKTLVFCLSSSQQAKCGLGDAHPHLHPHSIGGLSSPVTWMPGCFPARVQRRGLACSRPLPNLLALHSRKEEGTSPKKIWRELCRDRTSELVWNQVGDGWMFLPVCTCGNLMKEFQLAEAFPTSHHNTGSLPAVPTILVLRNPPSWGFPLLARHFVTNKQEFIMFLSSPGTAVLCLSGLSGTQIRPSLKNLGLTCAWRQRSWQLWPREGRFSKSLKGIQCLGVKGEWPWGQN